MNIDSEFYIISNNCMASHIYNQMKKQFNLPFINCVFLDPDFNYIVNNLENINFQKYSITQDTKKYLLNQTAVYPKVLIDDKLSCFFPHDVMPSNFEQKYKRRLDRMKQPNYSNTIFIYHKSIFSDGSILPNQKIIFTDKIIPEKIFNQNILYATLVSKFILPYLKSHVFN